MAEFLCFLLSGVLPVLSTYAFFWFILTATEVVGKLPVVTGDRKLASPG
jgi:hypothetical protein